MAFGGFVGGICAKTAVEKDGEVSVGRNGGGGGEIIDFARVAGNFAEQPAVGELSEGRVILGAKLDRQKKGQR